MQNFEKAESGGNGGREENETAVAGEVIETIKKRPGAMVTLIARFCTQEPIPRLPWVQKCPFTAESASGVLQKVVRDLFPDNTRLCVKAAVEAGTISPERYAFLISVDSGIQFIPGICKMVYFWYLVYT